jgi:hypothetical protein
MIGADLMMVFGGYMAAISSGHIKWLWFSFALLIFGPIAYTIIVTFRSLVQRSHPAVSVLYNKVRPLCLILKIIILMTLTIIVVIITISITNGSRRTANLHVSMSTPRPDANSLSVEMSTPRPDANSLSVEMSTPRPDANSLSVEMAACFLRADASFFLILPRLLSPSR